MKRQRKKYELPLRPWDKERMEKEKVLMKTFGLKKKREIWVSEALLRKYRRVARELIAKSDKKGESQLLEKLSKLGILLKNSTLDDVLNLTVENFLERRLQTVIFRKGVANTLKQARQLIVHKKVMIGGRRVIYPSYIVPIEEEDKIKVLG
ncbi:MAG: 30S ribosomal protein S4 [Candidatus Aenigmarchaeota archaeon]|nr:30S ribosomal protein S4 [Candidatus Aenigmarchaeota archaeon]